jgi:ABC-2 type transport system ATP-binding protein
MTPEPASGPAAASAVDQRPPQVALRAAGLRFSYGDLLAVDDVSVTLRAGEILGFLGPNGAGKSTTIKMLIGLLQPDAGTIEVLGMPMATHRAAIQARVGVVFEEKNLYPALSGRENLAFFGRLFGLRDVDLDGLLDRVGLGNRGDDRVSGYSKGMRQRLTVARALLHRPDLLVLDEPTDGLDPVSARAIRQVIREEADRGVAVLLTTHDMYEADELSDRVAFIDAGRILALDPPELLKLRHGQRAVRVRRRVDDRVEETLVPLDDDAGERLRELVAGEDLLTVHTEEATLEDVFVELAGRRLE